MSHAGRRSDSIPAPLAPKESTLRVIRQFARVYRVIGRGRKGPLRSGIVVN